MKKILMMPIEITSRSIKHLGSELFYIRSTFNALREHRGLLIDPDYRHLYDEARDFLFRDAVKSRGWKKEKREWGYSCLELLADIYNSDDDSEKFSIETVNYFLAQRKKVWNL